MNPGTYVLSAMALIALWLVLQKLYIMAIVKPMNAQREQPERAYQEERDFLRHEKMWHEMLRKESEMIAAEALCLEYEEAMLAQELIEELERREVQ